MSSRTSLPRRCPRTPRSSRWALGILILDGGDRFALTPLGEALKSDAPGAARSTVLVRGGAAIRDAAGGRGLKLTRVVPMASDVSIVEAGLA